MLRAHFGARAYWLAVPALLLSVLGCSLPGAADGGPGSARYIQLSVSPDSSRSISVTEYTVTGLDIRVRDPSDEILQTISWSAEEGRRTYSVPIDQDGLYRLDVTHRASSDGEQVDASETATFNIQSMRVTKVDIVPGRIGLISVDPGRPDLIVSSLAVACWSPTSVTYNYTVKNIGSTPAFLDGPTASDADNVSVQAYLSADTVFGNAGDIAAGGTILGISPLGTLDPGESFSGSFTASATVNSAATPYLVLKVDWGEVVGEADETNNATFAPLGPEGCHPDLIVSSLTVTSWTPTSISYEYIVTNIGGAAAPLDGPTASDSDNVSVQAFLSADTVFANAGDVAAGGTILGISPLGNLEPGESFSGAFSASATVDPFKLPYLVLKVDWGEVVAESNESNNTLATVY